jgi:hypothetical protein
MIITINDLQYPRRAKTSGAVRGLSCRLEGVC